MFRVFYIPPCPIDSLFSIGVLSASLYLTAAVLYRQYNLARIVVYR